MVTGEAQLVTYEATGVVGSKHAWWCATRVRLDSPSLDIGEPAFLGPAGAGTWNRKQTPIGILRRVEDGFIFARLLSDKLSSEMRFSGLVTVEPAQLRGTGWPGAPVGRPPIREETVPLTVVCSPAEADRWRAGTASTPGGFSAFVRQMLNERFPG